MFINLDYSSLRNGTVEGNAYESTWRWKGIQKSICIDSINLSSSSTLLRAIQIDTV